jgi:putative NIF3 family GTP cyclohydrolase 1 type 2
MRGYSFGGVLLTQTVQDVIDLIIGMIPGGQLDETVDTVKAGDPTQPVTGIVTTFLATRAVVERAIALGANFVITHEPVYYNHLDEVDWLEDDPVYAAKRRLIDEHGVVIWRCHDYWHRHRPDGILAGVLEALGWEAYADPEEMACCDIPPVSLGALADLVGERLGAQAIRITGDPEMLCRRVVLMVGAPGGRPQMGALRRRDVDAVICGEINEWETCEYVRDAVHAGISKGLVVVGHANSEEAGMGWLAERLRVRLPGIPITHVPAGDPFRFR